MAAARAAGLCLCAATAAGAPADLTGGVAVRGNHFVHLPTNQTVMLRGVSHASGEYSCVQSGHSAFEGGGGETASAVQAMKSWGNNVVRVPVNEDCWLGINGANPGGSKYQQAVRDFVGLITGAGMVVLLDLHWTAPGSTLATEQMALPDHDHAGTFWADAANTFKDNPLVVFELFNEPFPGSGDPTTKDWPCWATGSCSGISEVGFQAAGMTELVNAVRGTGATNVIILGGLAWSNDLDGWLDYVPSDPLKNTAAVWHSYDFNACVNEDCWNSVIKKVAAQYPVIVTESGFHIDYVTQLWPWCESHGVSYMAWVWNTWGGQESLISDYDGTPTKPYGQAWKDQLASVGPVPPPQPTPAPAPGPPPAPGSGCVNCRPPNDDSGDNCYHASWTGCVKNNCCSKEESADKCAANDNGVWCG